MKKIMLILLMFVVLGTTNLGLLLVLPSMSVEALDTAVFKEACEGEGASESAVCVDKGSTTPGSDRILGPDGVLVKVVQLVVVIVGIASVIMIIVGGMKYVLSSGDSNQAASAKNTVLYAVIGLVVATMSQAIVLFVLKKL